MIPYTTLLPIPYTSTGPAIWKSLAAVPVTSPSERNSMAGATTELANPVMGTTVPAPAKLAILSKTPRAVSSPARKMRQREQTVPACSLSRP